MVNVTFALHPAASKYLIARAVSSLPQVEQAFHTGKLIIGSGTTNLLIAEELLQTRFPDYEPYVAGVITQRSACATDPQQRQGAWCIEKGQLIDRPWVDFLQEFGPGDIFIKGANALDSYGNIGILMGDPQGGTIGQAIGIVKARGLEMIVPVGYEKLIPSCLQAEPRMGMHKTAMRIGLSLGYMVVSGTTRITEVESFKTLFDADAVPVAAGGVGGMEGAVVWAIECADEDLAAQVMDFARRANQRSPIKVKRKACADCGNPCQLKKS